MEDRKRLLSLPMVVPEQCSRIPHNATSESGVKVLKPILVDKQLSEPSSPTSKIRREFGKQIKPRQIHRGYSDLGSRVKKRVTLRFFFIFIYNIHTILYLLSPFFFNLLFFCFFSIVFLPNIKFFVSTSSFSFERQLFHNLSNFLFFFSFYYFFLSPSIFVHFML